MQRTRMPMQADISMERSAHPSPQWPSTTEPSWSGAIGGPQLTRIEGHANLKNHATGGAGHAAAQPEAVDHADAPKGQSLLRELAIAHSAPPGRIVLYLPVLITESDVTFQAGRGEPGMGPAPASGKMNFVNAHVLACLQAEWQVRAGRLLLVKLQGVAPRAPQPAK
jgi:hypothetical protein